MIKDDKLMIPRVLTIAGSAAQGSAGIQADLKTFQELDVYGMSAITAIVANNSRTQEGIFTNDVTAIAAQVYASMEFVGVDALKTGMLFTEDIIEKVATIIKELEFPNVVVDPVMIGKMGSQLLKDEAIETYKTKMLPLATIVTPNTKEAERLSGMDALESVEDMKKAAKLIYESGPSNVLIKGGSLTEKATDVLYDGMKFTYIESERIDTIHTSGAGCTYAAAITAELAKGKQLEEAVQTAKNFVTYAIKYALSFERGIGSTNHGALRNHVHPE